jgi:4'-phosphopantetheinyl transferase
VTEISGLGSAAIEHFPRFQFDAPAKLTVWSMRTAGLTLRSLDGFWELLDELQRSRIASLLSQDQRRDAVAAHGLARIIIGRFAHLAPGSVRISALRPGGKPTLVSHTIDSLDVNLTHCRDLVGCIVGMNCRVGIDAEDLTRELPIGANTRSLATEELAWLAVQTTRPTTMAFLHLWTLKEAILKAEGSGLARDLKSFAVLPFPPRIVRLPPDMGRVSDWRLWQAVRPRNHVLAAAAWQPS